LQNFTIAANAAGDCFRVEKRNDGAVKASAISEKWNSLSQLTALAENAEFSNEISSADLYAPIAGLPLKGLGLGLTYPSHRNEIGLADVVLFEKDTGVTRILDAIKERSHLDYEAEVSLLLHRSETETFGYLLHNDITDRGIQVREHDPMNLPHSFSLAKTFEGSNAHGPLMVVGDETIWNKLRIELKRNGKTVQVVQPSLNVMKPKEIHRLVFASPLSENYDWILIGTGTPAGTIFRAPSKLEAAFAFIGSGFNKSRTKLSWLNRFDFLKAGDTLNFESEILGSFSTKVSR
jgi:2-keto-4-pentenoate hydratase/2-oxohepta-3-ene-1,7-dioic acid hydratase in catechol pathway